jgi:hypothetical protein
VIGFGIRQRPKKDGVDNAKNRGVGPDAECERENGDQREAWVFYELPNCEPQIV